MDKFLYGHVFMSLGYLSKMWNCQHTVTMFYHLRNCQTVPYWLPHFTFPPAVYEFPVSPNPWQPLLLSIFFYYGHPSGLWSGIVVVDLLFLIGYDVEQLFMWFIAFHIFRERSIQILYLFLDWVFYLLWLSFQVLCIKNCRDFSALGMFINN